MTSTFNEPNATVIRNRANGYVLLPDGVYNAGYENKSHAIGAGSLTSSAVDLIRFLDSIEKSDSFSQETKSLFLKPAVTNRTLGMITWEYRSFDEKHLPSKGRVVMHAGSCPGFETVFGRFIDHEISIVILSNQSPLSVGSLFNEIGNLMLGFVPKPAEPMKFSFYQQVLASGAADFLSSARAASPNSIPSSSEINRMGYNYLGTGAFDKAIEIFKVNTLLNPSVGNTFDSLGHAYFMKGQLELAIASYQLAIKADPSNQGSKAALNKISALQQRRKD